MYEWVLVIGMVTQDYKNNLGEISTNMISGFTSKEKCEVAIKKLEPALAKLGNEARRNAGLKTGMGEDGRLNGPIPSVISRCIGIEK